jgi:ABC-type multidrug transport system ATPase subunit
MLMSVCANIENGSLVLIDEPERHLHPSLISQFVAIFNSILEWTGSFAILASHSAYFVREVPSDCVLVMRMSGDRVVVGNPSLQTFGADIGAVSYFIFNDELIARMLADVAQIVSVEGATDDYLNDVSISARMALERLI